MKVAPQTMSASGVWEPSLTRTFLARCVTCESPHPLAMKPALDVPNCPKCGTPVAEGESQTVSAVFTGGRGFIANALFKIGRWLNTLSKEN